MKKVLLFFIAFFILNESVYALDKTEVTFSKCIDGDTARVILNNEEIKIRFLAIDTPETKHPQKKVELFGQEASDFTCTALRKAHKIEIEYDNNSDKLDKYDRHLVWIFVDNELLQSQLIEKGLAKVAYLYNNYKYTYILEAKEILAKKNQIGIWSNKKSNYYQFIISAITIIVVIILFVFNKNFRNKIKRKAKTEIKKYIKTSI